MVATDLKTEIKKLMDKRSDLETEMNIIIERLSQPGAPGLSGNLVDSEGFPRSDIDIPVVRADRNRLSDSIMQYLKQSSCDRVQHVYTRKKTRAKSSGLNNIGPEFNVVFGNWIDPMGEHSCESEEWWGVIHDPLFRSS